MLQDFSHRHVYMLDSMGNIKQLGTKIKNKKFSPYPRRKYHFCSWLKNANVEFSARIHAPREKN